MLGGVTQHKICQWLENRFSSYQQILVGTGEQVSHRERQVRSSRAISLEASAQSTLYAELFAWFPHLKIARLVLPAWLSTKP